MNLILTIVSAGTGVAAGLLSRTRREVFAVSLGALFGCAVANLSACVSTPAGQRLTPGAEQGIVAGELVLCDAVLGALDPAALPACPGQSALLKAALDKVTALPDAGATFQSAAPLAFPIVFVPGRGYAVFHHSTHLGYVPTRAQAVAIASPQIQLFLDGLVDADAEGGR